MKNLAMILGALWLTLSVASPTAAAEGELGKETFLAQKCEVCHTVAVADIKRTTKVAKLAGPDLDGVGDKLEKEWMIAYIKREEVGESGKKHTKPFKGTDEELQTIVDWLATLTAPETPEP